MYREAPPEPKEKDPADGFRISTGFAGLLLVAAFFLPAVRDCGSDFVPSQVLDRSSWGDLLFAIPVFVFPYFAPLLLGIGALARLRRRDWGVTVGWGVHWAFFVVVLGFAVTNVYFVVVRHLVWPASLLAVALLLAVFLARARRVGARGHFRGAISLSLTLLAWFGFWLVIGGGEVRYGVYISFAGATALTVGTIGERRASLRKPKPLGE